MSILDEVGLGVILSFQTAGTEVFAAIKGALGDVQKGVGDAESAATSLGPGFMAAGTVAAAGIAVVAVAAAGIAVAAIKSAGEFQTLTTQLVTGAGESESAIGLVRQGILDMSGQIGVSADDLSKGLYNIESAGYHGAQGLEVLRIASEGAKVGGAQMATVADAVTTALNAYHLPASSAVNVTNDLIATVASGKMHMEDLAGSLGKILPIASALGVGFPEVSAAIATMTSQGTDAATATTSLRFIMAALAGPTSAAAKELKGLGVGAEEIPGITAAVSASLSDMGLHTSEVADTLAKGGLSAALTLITDAIGKKFPVGSAEYEAALKGAVGGTRGLTAALELTGPASAVFAANLAAISGAAQKGGTDVAGWSLIQGDFNQQMDRLHATLGALLIELGEKLLPTATKFAAFLADNLVPALKTASEWVQKHSDVLIPLAVGFGIVTIALAAYAIGMLAATVATAAFTVSMAILTAPITIVIAVIALLIAAGVALYMHWDQLKQIAGEVWGWIAQEFQKAVTFIGAELAALGGWFRDRWNDVVATVQNAVNTVVGWFQWLYDHNHYVKDLVDFILDLWKAFNEANTLIWNTVTQFITDAWNTISSTVTGVAGGIVSFLAAAWTTGSNDVHGFLNGVVALFTGLRDAILKPIESIGTWLLDAGKQLMQGLIDGIKSMAGAVWNAITGAMGSLGSGVMGALGFHDTGIGSNAGGTSNWRGGLTWVGENGPELLNLPSGAQILSNPQSNALMSSASSPGGGRSVEITLNVTGMTTTEVGHAVSQQVMNEILQQIRMPS